MAPPMRRPVSSKTVNKTPGNTRVQFVLGISHQTLYARCNTKVHFVLGIATKLYTLDVILEYSKASIREEKLVPSIQQAKRLDLD